MGVYVVNNKPWWSQLAGTIAGHFIDGMFQRDKAYREQKKNQGMYDRFLGDYFASGEQPQPQGLVSGAIDEQVRRNVQPPSYRPVSVDEMNQNAPATGVFPTQGSGIVTTPPQANVNLTMQAQPAQTQTTPMSIGDRLLRAGRHLNLSDPMELIKMAVSKDIENDAAFRNAQRVRDVVGDFPIGGSADEQTAYFAKNLPFLGNQGTNLVHAYNTAHPGYQMNIVDNGDRKDAVTMDKFNGTVANPLTMKQGINPTKAMSDQTRLAAAAMSANARRAGGSSARSSAAPKSQEFSPAAAKLYIDTVVKDPQAAATVKAMTDKVTGKIPKDVLDRYLQAHGYMK